jgi:hypothetical protein
MQMAHMHKPNWVHWHKPDWHSMGIHLGHVIHDPRFWATLALVMLFGLMIATVIFSMTDGTPATRAYPPIYPYMP